MSTAHVRPARLSDCTDLEGIQVRTSLMWPDFRRRLMDDPDWLGRPVEAVRKGEVLVLESGGETIGFGAIARRPDGDQEIKHLFICPGHWGAESNQVLIRALISRASAEGAWSVWIKTSRGAAAFYEASGFSVTEDLDTDVRMQCRIHAVVGAA